VGMSAGFLATLLLYSHVAFTWYVLVGSVATFAVGYLASLVLREPVAPPAATPAAP
jgi:hypothetical protein